MGKTGSKGFKGVGAPRHPGQRVDSHKRKRKARIPDNQEMDRGPFTGHEGVPSYPGTALLMEQQIIEFRDCRIVIVDEPQELPSQEFIDSLNATTEDGWKPWSARISERGRVVMERSR